MGRRTIGTLERWIIIGLAVLQPVIILGIQAFGRLPLSERLMDLALRWLLLGIAVWLRYWLFPEFRLAKLGGWFMVIAPACLLSSGSRWIDWKGFSSAFQATDCISIGVMIGAVLESLISSWIWAAAIPSSNWPQRLADQMRRLREATFVQKRWALAMAVLTLLGLYAMARTYLFDWILYSRLAAVLVALGFLIPFILLRSRIQTANQEEILRTERELETAIDRQLVLTVNGLEGSAGEDVAFWLNYRRVLLEVIRVSAQWEDWLYLLLILGLIVIEPYLFGAWAI